MRLDGLVDDDLPGAGKPVSRQWPLESTSAGSVSTEFGKRTSEPEQLLSATVPAKADGLERRLGRRGHGRGDRSGDDQGDDRGGERHSHVGGPLIRKGDRKPSGHPQLACTLLVLGGRRARSVFQSRGRRRGGDITAPALARSPLNGPGLGLKRRTGRPGRRVPFRPWS